MTSGVIKKGDRELSGIMEKKPPEIKANRILGSGKYGSPDWVPDEQTEQDGACRGFFKWSETNR